MGCSVLSPIPILRTEGGGAERKKRGRPPKCAERLPPLSETEALLTRACTSSVGGMLMEIPEESNTKTKQKRNNKRQRKVPEKLLNYVTPPTSRQPRLSKVSAFKWTGQKLST
jgi:hypothetical protein